MTRAVVLLSGGLDSTTAAALAKREGWELYGLTIRYGQVHAAEIEAARRVAGALGIARHVILDVDLHAFGGSSLLGEGEIPKDGEAPSTRLRQTLTSFAASAGQAPHLAPSTSHDAPSTQHSAPSTQHSAPSTQHSAPSTPRPAPSTQHPAPSTSQIPSTYVPARNTVFLSLALAWAESLGAERIVIGVNALDYSGYPDCRPEFIAAFEYLASLGTRVGVEGKSVRVWAPLQQLTKAGIIRVGLEIGVDYGLTHSCYDPSPEGRPCGECESCRLRARGFAEAGIQDPLLYPGR